MAFANDASSRVRKAVRMALNEIGRRGVAHIRDKIGIRVRYIGGYVERSEPGEPPRREFSVLWKSIKYRVEPKAKTVEDLIIYTTCEYAWYLEYGTAHIEPRPFWAVSDREIKQDIGRLFNELVAERLAREERGASMADFPANDSAFPDTGPG